MFVVLYRTGFATTHHMGGQITAYDGGTGALTVSVSDTNGTGTYADWTVVVGGSAIVANTSAVNAANSATAAGTSETNAASSAAIASTLPQNSQSADYTLVLADAGKHIFHPASDTTARAFTIPANAAVAYPIGTVVTVINETGAGTVTLGITSDTLRFLGNGATGSRTITASGYAMAIKVAATTWVLSGVNVS